MLAKGLGYDHASPHDQMMGQPQGEIDPRALILQKLLFLLQQGGALGQGPRFLGPPVHPPMGGGMQGPGPGFLGPPVTAQGQLQGQPQSPMQGYGQASGGMGGQFQGTNPQIQAMIANIGRGGVRY